MDVPPKVVLVGYADDLAMVVAANTKEKLKNVTERTLGRIGSWMKRN